MRHTVHIMLGSNAEQMLCSIKEYIIKYGSAESAKFFKALLYKDNIDGTASFNEALPLEDNADSFVAGIENLYSVEMVERFCIPINNRAEYLKSFFIRLYSQQITINNPGDSSSLHVCFHLPIYDANNWDLVKEFILIIKSISQSYNIDLFLISPDLSYLLEKERETLPLKMEMYQKQAKQTILDIIEFNKKTCAIAHAVLLQNCNSLGISLDLIPDSITRILGEYALLSLNHYDDLYSPALEDSRCLIHGLGLSVLSFDKYYFVQYLLHKAYINILDREHVSQEEVDVNKVSQIVQGILKENVDVFTKFYDRSVRTKLDRGVHQDDIITDVYPELKEEIQRLTNVFQSFINDDSLSLPEKKATLAQLLGEDDELLVGYMFNKQQLVIDDCSKDVLDLFVRLNNNLVDLYPSKLAELDTVSLGGIQSEKEQIAEYASLSGSRREHIKLASALIDEVKSIKIKMRECSNYIRQKSEELDSVELQIRDNTESQRRLTQEGFVFEGKTYHLQSKITETPCGEDYIPTQNLPSKVDLRPYCTPVKDQGEIGACSAFSIVSIYEYILNRNKNNDTSLSECFAYYNVRKAVGMEHEDTGSSLFDIISSISTVGVCHDRYFPYTKQLDAIPPDTAYDDASKNKIVKALNVKVALNDLKSAISEGYPVAISLKIFDSFQPKAGFISRPSLEEMQGEWGNHAMVLCGYSEDEKIFIVRNSWGTKFGDRGYCYIPYSYISDPQLLNVACIITQISNEEYRVGGKDNKTTLSFDLSNSQIKAAILKNLIEEEKYKLSRLCKIFNENTIDLNTLSQTLGNNSVRTSLCEGTIKRLKMEQRELLQEKDRLQADRISELENFDRDSKGARMAFWIVLLINIISFGVICISSSSITNILFSTASYILYACIVVGFFGYILWQRQRKHKRVVLAEDFKERLRILTDEITNRRREVETMHITTHVAGMIIDNLSSLSKNLHAKYNGIKSYVGNLKIWRQEEEGRNNVAPLDREPFLSLISNDCLDQYFEKSKDELTDCIRLDSMFMSHYNITEEAIIKFKNTLKNNLVNALWSKIADFSIYKHIVSEEKYDYLDQRYANVNTLLRRMDEKSECFMRRICLGERQVNCKLLFLPAILEVDRSKWEDLCNKNFNQTPALCSTTSNDKVTILQISKMKVEEINLLNEI